MSFWRSSTRSSVHGLERTGPSAAATCYHHTRHAWEQDRRREREVRARGDEFRRYTYDDVTVDRTLVEAELCALLPQANVAPA